jgi:hypothetical protein
MTEPVRSWEDELRRRGGSKAGVALLMQAIGNPSGPIPIFPDGNNPNGLQVRQWVAEEQRVEKARADAEAAEQKARDQDVARWTKIGAWSAIIAAVAAILGIAVSLLAWRDPLS